MNYEALERVLKRIAGPEAIAVLAVVRWAEERIEINGNRRQVDRQLGEMALALAKLGTDEQCTVAGVEWSVGEEIHV